MQYSQNYLEIETEILASRMSIEKSEEKSDLPPFKLGTDLYDRTTFNGRLQHFSNVIDPRSLLKSEDDIRIAENILKISATQYEGGIIPGKSNKGRKNKILIFLMQLKCLCPE